MDLTHAFRRALHRRILDVAGVATIVAPVLAGACGGKVFVDGRGAGSGSGECALTTTGTGNGQVQVTECFAMPSDGCPTKYEATMYVVPSVPCAYLVSIDCGPIEQDDECCFIATEEMSSCTTGSGRPLLVDGHARTARPDARDRGWADGPGDTSPALEGLSTAARAALADAWTADALLEHASIASFSRFALQLLAVGAPADLVALAHRAALDEVRHARLCFALAAGYRGGPVAPSAFPFDGALAVGRDLVELAAATAREGCIGETLAALLAAEQLARAEDPAVRRALAVIVDDEARHAELAWRTVAWAMEQGGHAVRAAVGEVFANAARCLPIAPELGDGLTAREAAAHGRLDRASARGALVRALAEVVLPCAEALLADPRARVEQDADDSGPATQRSQSHEIRGLRARG